MDSFKLKFWGVRGSYPVPGPDTVEIGGNTSCVEVRINNELILIDAGTGAIALGDKIMKESMASQVPVSATILFSHMHHDHNQGFPFFKPAYLGSSILYLFGPKMFQEDIQEVLSRAMLPPFFPVELAELNSARIIQTLDNSSCLMIRPGDNPCVYNKFRDRIEESEDSIKIETLKGYAHPKGGVLFYKISFHGKTMVYASDTEGYMWGDQKLINFALDCDLLIHDAQYTAKQYKGETGMTRQGFGHSTPEMAIDVAKKARVKKLILFHHDPEHADAQIRAIEKACQKQFPASQAAYEGLEIELL